MLSTKDPAETITVEFDFSGMTPNSITSATVTSSVYSGDNTTALTAGGKTLSGTSVFQVFSSGTNGSIYELRCLATDSGGAGPFLVNTKLAVVTQV